MSIFVRSFFTTFDVDYHDKSALMNLNLCLTITHHPIALWKNRFNEFNRGHSSLKNEFRKDPPGRCTRTYWCRVLTDNARSSCDIRWDRSILGHFFHQHTFNIAWPPGLKKDFLCVYNIVTGDESWICAQNKATVHRVGLWVRAKSNESLWKITSK